MVEKLRKNKFIQKYKSFIKFSMVGGLNFLIDLGIFTFLANVCGWDKIAANVVSVTASMLFSFVMNYRFVWHSDKGLFETMVGFFTVSIFSNYFVQNLVLTLASTLIGEGDIQNIVCKLCASMAGALTNYFGYKVVFTSDKVTRFLAKIKKRFSK